MSLENKLFTLVANSREDARRKVVYWNTSGRAMLMNHLMGEGLAIIEPKR